MVGTIDIESGPTSALSQGADDPTAKPSQESTAPAASPSSSPSLFDEEHAPHDDHDGGMTEADMQAYLDDKCANVADWWKSVQTRKLGGWRKTGLEEGYASSFVLDGYTGTAYAALRREEWTDFDVQAYPIFKLGAGACIFSRPPGEDGHAEVVTFTYRSLAYYPQPGDMRYSRDSSIREARKTAEDSIVRD